MNREVSGFRFGAVRDGARDSEEARLAYVHVGSFDERVAHDVVADPDARNFVRGIRVEHRHVLGAPRHKHHAGMKRGHAARVFCGARPSDRVPVDEEDLRRCDDAAAGRQNEDAGAAFAVAANEMQRFAVELKRLFAGAQVATRDASVFVGDHGVARDDRHHARVCGKRPELLALSKVVREKLGRGPFCDTDRDGVRRARGRGVDAGHDVGDVGLATVGERRRKRAGCAAAGGEGRDEEEATKSA